MCKLIKLKDDRKNVVSQFEGAIKDRDGRPYANIEEAVEDALRRSFRDINFRTLHEKSTDYPELGEGDNITTFLIEKLREAGFIKKFVAYFSKIEEDFDKWHHEACEIFLNVLKKYYCDAKYGKAQKIVNMMFKHLYCMNFGGSKDNLLVLDEDYFLNCHLTLDSFTLEWFYREVVGKWYNKKDVKDRGDQIHKGNFDSWSNLEYSTTKNDYTRYTEVKYSCKNEDNCRLIKSGNKYFYHYMFFVTIIREFFETEQKSTDEQKRYVGKTPFLAEFYIWPDIQLHLTAEALFGQSIGQEEALEELEKETGAKFNDFNAAQKYYKNLDRTTKGKILKKKIECIEKIW